MKLQKLIEQYVNYRKALGEKYTAGEGCLKSFCKFTGTSN